MNLEMEEAWPTEIGDYLAAHHDLLLAHAKRQQEISKAIIEQQGKRRKQIPDGISIRAQAAQVTSLLPERIRCWHCTRLRDEEITWVVQEGMEVPSQELLLRKIQAAENSGDLDQATAALLRNQKPDPDRFGEIHFVMQPPAHVDETYVDCFFRHWGGEILSLDLSYDEQSDVKQTLRKVGTPCVIEADLVAHNLKNHANIGKKIILRYLSIHGFGVDEWFHEDLTLKRVPGTDIRRVVTRSDVEFAKLTGCDAWQDPL